MSIQPKAKRIFFLSDLEKLPSLKIGTSLIRKKIENQEKLINFMLWNKQSTLIQKSNLSMSNSASLVEYTSNFNF